jgi:hypothetical protein
VSTACGGAGEALILAEGEAVLMLGEAALGLGLRLMLAEDETLTLGLATLTLGLRLILAEGEAALGLGLKLIDVLPLGKLVLGDKLGLAADMLALGDRLMLGDAALGDKLTPCSVLKSSMPPVCASTESTLMLVFNVLVN